MGHWRRLPDMDDIEQKVNPVNKVPQVFYEHSVMCSRSDGLDLPVASVKALAVWATTPNLRRKEIKVTM